MKYIISITLSLILMGCSATDDHAKKLSTETQERELLHSNMIELIAQEIEKTLVKNVGNILSPSDVEKIDWSDVRTGFSFTNKIVFSPKYQFERVWRLNQIDGNKYIFNSYEKGKLGSGKRTYVNGMEHSTLKLNIRGKDVDVSNNYCSDFVEGACEYKIGDSEYKQTINYLDGVWTTMTYKEGKFKSKTQSIYDKRGIRLFKSTDGFIIRRHITFSKVIEFTN